MAPSNSKQILWKSLEAIMTLRYGSVNISRLSRDAKVGLGTVARLKSDDSSIALDKIDKLADSLGVEPWQLLAPDFDPAAPKEGFSPLANDIARALDRITDPAAQQRAYALAIQVVELANVPALASPPSEKLPTPQPASPL